MDILVILTNWCREENLPRIIEAFRSQTVKVRMVLIDNSPRGMDQPPGIEMWRVPRNLGPPCRFVPALAEIEASHILFYDDDLLPGPRAVEWLVECSNSLGGKYATIGQIGRRFVSRRNGRIIRYRRLNVPRFQWGFCNPVDMTCRAHFVQRKHLHHLVAFRELILAKFPEAEEAVGIHDDMLLCLGIQKATGYPSYLTAYRGREWDLRCAELPDAGSLNQTRATHMQERHNICHWARSVGWQSVWREPYAEICSRMLDHQTQEIVEP